MSRVDVGRVSVSTKDPQRVELHMCLIRVAVCNSSPSTIYVHNTLTNFTLESKLLWDFVQANQRRMSNFPKDVGEDGGRFGAGTKQPKKLFVQICSKL